MEAASLLSTLALASIVLGMGVSLYSECSTGVVSVDATGHAVPSDIERRQEANSQINRVLQLQLAAIVLLPFAWCFLHNAIPRRQNKSRPGCVFPTQTSWMARG